MKRKTLLIVGIVVIVIIVFFVLRSNEDSWIKNSKGEYVQHGAPAETSVEVLTQQDAVSCALQLYAQKKSDGMEFSSQCLGVCGDYAVDIVHVPRDSKDDLIENQCEDFRNEKVGHFIELAGDGGIVRIE